MKFSLELFRFAASTGSHGSPQGMITSAGDSRAWLNEAVNHYASETFNPVCMHVV